MLNKNGTSVLLEVIMYVFIKLYVHCNVYLCVGVGDLYYNIFILLYEYY